MARSTHPTDPARLVEIAVRYADHGWPVLPLHTPNGDGCSCRAVACSSIGKHPRTRHGAHEATTDIDQVRAWWDRWPDANIGVATGSVSGLLVLDVDLPNGPDSLAELEHEHRPLPATCEQRTGSGGRQLFFVHSSQTLRNRAAVRPGIDVRGSGGYVVVPPSLHASGERYAWVGRVPPADPPAWLVAAVQRHDGRRIEPPRHPARLPKPSGSRSQRYAAAALRQELVGLAAAVEGTRNATLNRAAFVLGQLVGGGLLEHDHVAAELERVAARTGLGTAEIRRTIASGLSAGLDQPRTIPDLPTARGAATDPPGSAPMRRMGARRR